MNDLWYVATPYRSYPFGLKSAFKMASRIGAYLLQHNVPIYVPIAHTHPIALGGTTNPKSNIWLTFNEPFINFCTGMVEVHLPGWQDSTGMDWERVRFTSLAKPIIVMRPFVLPERLRKLYVECSEQIGDVAVPTDS